MVILMAAVIFAEPDVDIDADAGAIADAEVMLMLKRLSGTFLFLEDNPILLRSQMVIMMVEVIFIELDFA